MAARWVMFCEAAADFRTASGLIDRVLAEAGAAWVRDLLEPMPDALRVWSGESAERPFFDLHRTYAEGDARGLRRRYGYFDGAPAAPGALLLYTAAQIVRDVRRTAPGERWALVLVWDADQQGADRRTGLAQGRGEAEALLGDGAVVVGSPDPNREAWVLAGFEPADETERGRLEVQRRGRGFWPNEHPERLTTQDEHAPGHTKVVLRALTATDAERETRCWTETPLKTLRERGAECGLTAFLTEVKARLLPRIDPSARGEEGRS